uniref:Uncharacterized protein n=1 Tax=Cannabis sativa TaxID=3483 RepID=A0A803QHH4_CANSA
MTPKSTPADPSRHTIVGKIPSLGFSFPMRPPILGHDYLTKAEGVRQPSSPDPVLDLVATSQNLVPKVGRVVVPHTAAMLDSMSLSVSKLTSKKWAVSSNVDPYTLSVAAKQQAVGMALFTKRTTKEVGNMTIELSQLRTKAQAEKEVKETVCSLQENLDEVKEELRLSREEKDKAEEELCLSWEEKDKAKAKVVL